MKEESKIARAVALRYARSYGGDLSDYEQEAWVAILLARRSFDSNRGTRWGVYAWRAAVRALYGYACRMRCPVSGSLSSLSKLNAARSVEWNEQSTPVADVGASAAQTPEAIRIESEQRDFARTIVNAAIDSDVEADLARTVLLGGATLRAAAARHGVSASRVLRATQRVRATIVESVDREVDR